MQSTKVTQEVTAPSLLSQQLSGAAIFATAAGAPNCTSNLLQGKREGCKGTHALRDVT
jgi:hypothetical protein